MAALLMRRSENPDFEDFDGATIGTSASETQDESFEIQAASTISHMSIQDQETACFNDHTRSTHASARRRLFKRYFCYM